MVFGTSASSTSATTRIEPSGRPALSSSGCRADEVGSSGLARRSVITKWYQATISAVAIIAIEALSTPACATPGAATTSRRMNAPPTTKVTRTPVST